AVTVSLLWICRSATQDRPWLDGQLVSRITPALLPASRVSGKAQRLRQNTGRAFKGAEPGSKGFVLAPEEAERLIATDARNSQVLSRFMNADDLHTRHDLSGSRWIINFHNWPISVAQEYGEVLQIAKERVKPDFARKNPRSYPGVMDQWWLYW